MDIRPARVDEAASLSKLSFSSKASWGYDAAFMEQCREELTVQPSYIEGHFVYVAEDQDGLLGFHALAHPDGEGRVVLDSLFVSPAAQRKGVGRALFAHAVSTARSAGARQLVIESDPYAAGFYRAMGAEPAGTAPSGSIPGRLLPRLIVRLGPD
jgi:GNAT superfamily N-acetyltransferase